MHAILFDTFGTLVDWRSSLIAQFQALSTELGKELPAERLADRWRSLYKPSMDRVRQGQQPWTILDDLHRVSLHSLLEPFGLSEDESLVTRVTAFWHQLKPWPDVLPGLAELKKHYIIGPLSNANLSLMVNLSKHAGLPWDVVFGTDLFQHYKPDPEVYLGACRLLGLPPGQVTLCAAHNYDLRAARDLGLKTVFVPRPREHGPGQQSDLMAEDDWDWIADDLTHLARQLAGGQRGSA